MQKLFCYQPDAALVTTTRGKVRGYIQKNISIFKGIPYAKARRFHAPEPVEPWEDVLDVTSYGYVCPLLELGKPNGELLVPHRYWVMNEDCLNLNIWTPECDGEKRPVLVWLHGGGFESGSAIEHQAYEGENMCREGQVVVVSINHRLNVLGYCDLSDFGEEYANSGNAGTDDIIAALKWIQENIASFGGDPKNVTLFGQSGGGAKITTLLQTPDADGLFAKGINMSGVTAPILPDSKGSGQYLAQALMEELSVLSVKELETVPYEALAAAYKKVKPALAKEGKNVGGTPHPNAFYKGEPAENGFRSETAHIPLIVGSVYGEFTSSQPPVYDRLKMSAEEGKEIIRKVLGEEGADLLLPLYEKAYPERHPLDLLALDFIFRLPGLKYIAKRSELNQCTWSYLFNLDLPIDGGRTPGHCSDVPYVFHNTEIVPSTYREGIREKLETQIFETVMAFARTGNPNNDTIPDWPASSPGKEYTMIFDTDTKVRLNHDVKLIPLFAKYMGPIFTQHMKKIMEGVQH